MQSEEQRLIDGLFSRLKEAESRSASRDSSAEGDDSRAYSRRRGTQRGECGDCARETCCVSA